MSVVNSGAPGIVRAISKLRPQSNSSRMIEQARAAQRAARLAGSEELAATQRQIRTRSVAVQGDLEAWPLPGLAPMTRVRTSFGDVHAAALRKGDEVLTRDGGFKPILWLNRINLEEHVLNIKPDSNPIVIAPGALGTQIPSTEIMVSPRQLICADEKNGLKRPREAAMLISRPGIRRLRETSLSYTMFHVGQPAEVYCEGLYLVFPMEA